MTDFHLARAQVVSGLPRLKNRTKGTGAITLNPDSRLIAMASLSQLQGTTPAPSTSLAGYAKTVYDQGGAESCVAYSIAGMQSIFEQILRSQTIKFDADELYHAVGGSGSSGVSAPDALWWDESTGLQDIATGQRYKIKAFAFADPTSDAGIATIKTAISANCPCVLALLLPSDFADQVNGSGDCNGTVTSDYHQVCVIGYTEDRVIFLNSYGDTWGNKGIGTIPWSFLKDPAQSGSVFAYTISDTGQPGAKQFFLRAWSAPVVENTPSLLDRLRSLKLPTAVWVLFILVGIALVITFFVIYRSELFASGNLRPWIVSILSFAVLASANRAIFAPGPGNVDPTFVRYVIAFNSVLFIVIGLAALVITCSNWGTPFFIAGACILTGGFLGLLFGYPSGIAQRTSNAA